MTENSGAVSNRSLASAGSVNTLLSQHPMNHTLTRWAATAALVLSTPFLMAADAFTSGPGWLDFPGGKGPGAGKHVVLLAGDEEYRSEESLPMLARILSERHGFHCTVLFSYNEKDGKIDPDAGATLGKPEALETADALVLGLRFRKWNEVALTKFDAALKRGVPVVATRTSTHAFSGIAKDSAFATLNHNSKGGFGKRFLGETWVDHWGKHKGEATRTAVEPGAEKHAVLNGVEIAYADTDVYEAYPPVDAQILLRGVVLKDMDPKSPPSERPRKRSIDKQEQGVNSPAMAVAWVREIAYAGEVKNRVLCTTMCSASDLKDESLRRLLVNGVFWGLKLDVPAKADVTPLVEWKPSKYSFGLFHRNLQAADFAGVLPDPAPATKKPAAK